MMYLFKMIDRKKSMKNNLANFYKQYGTDINKNDFFKYLEKTINKVLQTYSGIFSIKIDFM